MVCSVLVIPISGRQVDDKGLLHWWYLRNLGH
jgi:hypothetical protein